MSGRGRGETGFSLVALLVVVVVLGVLAAVAVPSFLSQRARAHDASVQADLRSVAMAVGAADDGGGDLEGSALDDVVVSPGTVLEVAADGDGWCVRGWYEGLVDGSRWVLDAAGLARDDARCAGPVVRAFP